MKGLLLGGLVLGLPLSKPVALAQASSPPAPAAAPESAQPHSACSTELLKRVQRSYQNTIGFRARFVQEDHRRDGSVLRGEGELAYLRPGRMRWSYAPPQEQLLVTDGKTLWLYDPLLENVTLSTWEDLGPGTLLAFFLGDGNFSRDFVCRPLSRAAPQDELRYVELTPREAIPALDFLQIGLRIQDARLLALRIVDAEGNLRSLHLHTFQKTKDFPKGHFEFQITPQMEVIYR